MTMNVGTADRALRLLIGAVLLISPIFDVPAIWSSSALSYLSMLVGAVLIVTAVFKFCPLYRVFGISTCKV